MVYPMAAAAFSSALAAMKVCAIPVGQAVIPTSRLETGDGASAGTAGTGGATGGGGATPWGRVGAARARADSRTWRELTIASLVRVS